MLIYVYITFTHTLQHSCILNHSTNEHYSLQNIICITVYYVVIKNTHTQFILNMSQNIATVP